MWTRQHKQNPAGRLVIPLMTACVVSYFAFHAYHGELGIYANEDYEARVIALQAQLADATERRVAMQRRVQLIEDGTLDKDMLDEQARRALNLTQADELSIMRPAAPHG
jgi:cell division protein FtsB